jgi:hypothetical protein
VSNPVLALFSNLTDYQETSPPTPEYNCIAWAAEDPFRWWWPDDPAQYFTSYWPDGFSRDQSVDCFRGVFSVLLGYGPSETEDREDCFQKVAIYVDRTGKVTHMARQLPSGRWSSKLGRSVDIEHGSLADLAGTEYGSVALILKRPIVSMATSAG